MAFYDNKYWLLSHIRNSFISTDDTGMCELIMAGEEGLRKQLKQKYDYYPDEDDSEDEDDLSHESYDLQADIDFNILPTSNIVSQIEKIDLSRKKISRVKHVKWESNRTELTQDQLDDMFVRKEPPQAVQPKQSLFSKTFLHYKTMPTNPYINHEKFDGSGQVKLPTKNFKIFLTMLPENNRNYPISICCVASAKIYDLIGLILLKCSIVYEDYPWKPISNYGLYIVEDDGEVDSDFPSLDNRENIGKFGFHCLGLVEHSNAEKSVSSSNSDTLTFGKSFEEATNKKLKDLAKLEQEKQQLADLELLEKHKKKMEASLYKSYQIIMFNKMRAKVDIHIGISNEKIEIEPIQKSSKFSIVKPKFINFDMIMVAGCEKVDVRTNKTSFKIYYLHSSGSNEFPTPGPPPQSSILKNYEFEADHATAEEIIHKINYILDVRSSRIRKQYLEAQETKLYRKEAFT